MDVVANLEPLAAGGWARGNVAVENVLGVLNQSRVVVLVVILKKLVVVPKTIMKCAYSVQVEVGDVVAKVSHSLLAARLSSAA